MNKMPLFEFKCNKCDQSTDKIMSFEESEKYNEVCKCGKGKMEKIPVSNFNVKYKGNWFSKNRRY